MTRRQLPTARTDRAEPCAKCPYRKDAPLAHWHAEHFTDLLAKSGDPMCPVYLCHNADGNLCAGDDAAKMAELNARRPVYR